MKSLVIFDLDGTLARSKSPLEADMARLLHELMGVMKVAVISGGAWPHFEKQLLADIKQVWDPDFAKRKTIKALLDPMIPGFSVGMGGSSSIDVTRPGVDKAYGIHKLKEVLGVPISEMLFVGDEPARTTGATCIRVRDPEETGRVIEAVIACVGG